MSDGKSRSDSVEGGGVDLDVPGTSSDEITPSTFNEQAISDLDGSKSSPHITFPKNSSATILVKSDLSTTATDNDTTGTISNVHFYTNRFYLTNMQEQRAERHQVVETFGDPAVFFFDERTKIYSFSGTLLEGEASTPASFAGRLGKNRYRWASAFQQFYDNHARGTQLIKNNNIVVLMVDNYILYGYLLNLSIGASIGLTKPFSFSMLIKEHRLVYENLQGLYNLTQYTSTAQGDNGMIMDLLNAQVTVLDNDIIELKKSIADKEADLVAVQAGTPLGDGIASSISDHDDITKELDTLKANLEDKRSERTAALKELTLLLTSTNRFDKYDKKPDDATWPRTQS